MPHPWVLVAVGDLQLGDSPTTVGYGFRSRYAGSRVDALLTEVQAAIGGADMLFGNLESTLVPPPDHETRRSVLQLRGQPQFAADLRRAGFTVLNVANNHAVQHGDDTFHQTVATVRSAGIACCGIRGTAPWASEPVLLPSSEPTVGVLGYCLRPRQYGAAVPPYAEGTQDEICGDVARLRATGVTVIVSLHWGEEFVAEPSGAEVAMAHAIIDAGAAVILGHHPHVVRPIERYRSGLIAYSLGNFIGDMVWYPPFRRGAILRCSVAGETVHDAISTDTHLRDDYTPTIAAAPEAVAPNGRPRPGLDAASYSRAIADTMRRQRIAAYRYAVRRLPQTPLPILTQMVVQTVRNKLSALTGLGQR